MLNQKKYSCGICKTTPDQISHHKSHIETQKHKDKRELFELKLYKLSEEELISKYKTTVIDDICNETETILYSFNDNNIIKNDTNLNYYKDIQDIMEKQNCISNKEALKEKIHEIHNFLRNNGAGYGMNALKVFNILYGLKKIEENGLIDSVGLKRPECEFSYLLSVANENKDEKLSELIYGPVLDAINDEKKSKIKDILFYEIPKKLKANVFTHLIKEIDNITKIEKSSNVLLSGKVYEYFIGRDESAISELGAYFTDRHIVDYIYQKLDPSINDDGSVSTMIDMFGGSGGFTTGYINYLNEKYPKGINWKTELSKISHFDMNEDVIKSAGLEFFCLTGVLPDMNNNLGYKNSFTDDFLKKKYKYPITNPPYGGDKNSKTVVQEKGEKIKEYIKNELKTITDEGVRIARQKQLKSIEAREKQDKQESNKTKVCVKSCSDRIENFARIHKLTGNDKEACSFMLLMDVLDIGGTAIGVLKEGVFFNKTYKDIRKCLVENYNVKEVISVPSDQFENTSTKTSIIIFDNTEDKTKEVKFYDLVVKRYEADKFVEYNGVIMIAENKGDISCVSDILVSVATREEILTNPICSLNAKDYNKKVIICGEGYELVKIDDICEFTKYKSQKPSDGKFNHYTCSNTIKKCSDGNINGEYILIGTRGTITEALHYYNGKFGCGDNMLIFNSNTINNKYIYNILLSTKEQIKNYINGSTIPMISLSQFKNIQIPIPKSEQKIKEWVDKISKPYDEKNTKTNKIKELEEYIQNKIKDYCENEKDIVIKTLGDVSKINYGKRITKTKDEGSKYLAYGGGDLMSYKVNQYNRDGVTYKISRDGLSKHNCITKLYGKLFLNDTALSLDTLDDKFVTNIFIGEFLLNKKNYIYDNCTHGTAQLHINIDNLMKLNIQIPSLKLQKELELTIDEIGKLNDEVKEADILYNQLIKELSEEAIPNNPVAQLTVANVDTIKNTSTTPSASSASSTSSTTVASLKEQCKSLGIKGYSKKNKAELIKLIQEMNDPSASV